MTNLKTESRLFASAIAALTLIAITASHAIAGSCCSSKTSNGTSTATPDCHTGQEVVQTQREDAFQSPHGGQLSRTLWNYFDVVYGAEETRVYVYDMFRHPVAARGIEGHVIMRVRSNGREYRYPVHHAANPGRQDYLAVRVNLTRVDDGDMDVRFELTNLRNSDEPNVRFTQVFATAPSVGPRTTSGVAEQITRLPNLVRRDSQSRGRHPRITVATASDADDAAIRAQRTCPVMKQALGSHGRPTKITVDGREVFVCCKGCVDTVKKNPSLYLARVSG